MTEAIKDTLKAIVVEAGLEMIEQGLSVATWGNISLRDEETHWIYITPSGMDYETIRRADIVVLNEDLRIVDGTARPSIEKRMHAAIYRARQDVNAVIHTHPLYSAVLGVNGMDLPGISEDFVQIVGERITCADYALPGTETLAQNVVTALGERNAVLMPNHGTLCVGADMKTAFKVCQVVEKTAHIYILAKSIGTPRVLPPKDIQAMQKLVQNYGQERGRARQ
jgi:L-fuculose-phosphate aldolase